MTSPRYVFSSKDCSIFISFKIAGISSSLLFAPRSFIKFANLVSEFFTRESINSTFFAAFRVGKLMMLLNFSLPKAAASSTKFSINAFSSPGFASLRIALTYFLATTSFIS